MCIIEYILMGAAQSILDSFPDIDLHILKDLFSKA